MQRKRNLWIDQYDAFKGSDDIIEFGSIRLQKLTSSRYIEEEIFNSKVAAYRTRTRLLTSKTATSNRQMRTQFLTFHSGLQFYLSHSSNRCQCLSTETHRTKREKVVCFTNLRSGMTFERKTCISFRHTLSIIDYLNRSAASINHQHINMRCSCINGILHQLLNNRSWTLNNLTSCNLVGYTIW